MKLKSPRNTFETRIHAELKKARLKVKYESEKLLYLISGHYIPDFVITTRSGNKIYIETKGYLRPEHKRKMVAVKKYHPTIDLRILFYASKEKDIRWAVKNKIPYAVGSVPSEWIADARR